MRSFKIRTELVAIKLRSFFCKFLTVLLFSLFIISDLSAEECLHEAKEAFDWDFFSLTLLGQSIYVEFGVKKNRREKTV
jgi:hypothetical protein